MTTDLKLGVPQGTRFAYAIYSQNACYVESYGNRHLPLYNQVGTQFHHAVKKFAVECNSTGKFYAPVNTTFRSTRPGVLQLLHVGYRVPFIVYCMIYQHKNWILHAHFFP